MEIQNKQIEIVKFMLRFVERSLLKIIFSFGKIVVDVSKIRLWWWKFRTSTDLIVKGCANCAKCKKKPPFSIPCVYSFEAIVIRGNVKL